MPFLRVKFSKFSRGAFPQITVADSGELGDLAPPFWIFFLYQNEVSKCWKWPIFKYFWGSMPTDPPRISGLSLLTLLTSLNIGISSILQSGLRKWVSNETSKVYDGFMNFLIPCEIQGTDKEVVKISCRGGVYKNHEKINLPSPPPIYFEPESTEKR